MNDYYETELDRLTKLLEDKKAVQEQVNQYRELLSKLDIRVNAFVNYLRVELEATDSEESLKRLQTLVSDNIQLKENTGDVDTNKTDFEVVANNNGNGQNKLPLELTTKSEKSDGSKQENGEDEEINKTDFILKHFRENVEKGLTTSQVNKFLRDSGFNVSVNYVYSVLGRLYHKRKLLTKDKDKYLLTVKGVKYLDELDK
jgi:hypothetical protein